MMFPSFRTTTATTTPHRTRHYYADNGTALFEQSLDVYTPVGAAPPPPPPPSQTTPTRRDDTDAACAAVEPNGPMPVVLLVVGSAWMGHHWSIYRPCNWWNAAGPQAIAASCHTTCVCIRHRGSFFQLPPLPRPSMVVAAVLAASSLAAGAAVAANTTTTTPPSWSAAASAFGRGGGGSVAAAIVATAALLTTAFWWYLATIGRGSATFDDMLHDVAQAVAWVHTHRELWEDAPRRETRTAPSTTGSGGAPPSPSTAPPIVFGGYSSGGHVATSLLQRRDVWAAHQLPDPDRLLAGILLISGVLAVQPCERELLSHSAANGKAAIVAGKNEPRWMTDFVMRTVWGPEWQKRIPSPVEQPVSIDLPHLLIGNQNEVFGLPWLDAFFCSQQYAEKVTRLGGKALYRTVPSDHWNILRSRRLTELLRAELPALVHSSKHCLAQGRPGNKG